MQKYRVLSVIGSGAYSQVFKAIELSTGKLVAIKQMQLSKSNMAINRIMMREARILSEIGKHPNVVKLLQCFKHKQSLCLVLEYLPMDLITFYKSIRHKQKRSLTDAQIRHIFKQICLAVAFMHAKNLMHRDIKPENVLIDPSTLRVKLIDFGFAKYYLSEKNTNYMITRWYRPPQVVLGLPYDLKVDIFSLGALLLELYSEREVFRSASNLDQLYWIVNVCGGPGWAQAAEKMKALGLKVQETKGNLSKLTKGLTDDVKNLIEKMLQVAPSKRIDIFQTLQHPYFKETPKKTDTPSSNTSTLKADSPSSNKLLLKHRQSLNSNNNTVNHTNSTNINEVGIPQADNDSLGNLKKNLYEENSISDGGKQKHTNQVATGSNKYNYQRHNNSFHSFQRQYRNFHQSNEGRKKIVSGKKLAKRSQSYSQGLTIVAARLKNNNNCHLNNVNNSTDNIVNHDKLSFRQNQQTPVRINSQDTRKSLHYSGYAPKYIPSLRNDSVQKTGHSNSVSKTSLGSYSNNRQKRYNTNASFGQKSIQKHEYLSTISSSDRHKAESVQGSCNYRSRNSINNKSGHIIRVEKLNPKDRQLTMFAKVKKIVNCNFQQRDNAYTTARIVKGIEGQFLRNNLQTFISTGGLRPNLTTNRSQY